MTLEAPPRTPLPEDAIDGKKLATKDARARSRLDPDAGASESEISDTWTHTNFFYVLNLHS